MENRAHALIAGIFVLVLAAAGITGLWWFSGQQEASREFLVVTRGNVTGLNPQAQVRYRGMRVGKVLDIRLDPKDVRDILITVRVPQSVPLTRGMIAKLGYQGVTGMAHVQLEDDGRDPRPLAPEAGEPPRIAMQPSLLQELGESGGSVVRQAGDLLQRANAVLDEENRRRLTAILGNLEVATKQLADTTARMAPALGRVERVASDENILRLQQGLENFKRATATADLTLARWKDLAAELQGMSRQLETAVGNAGGADGVATLAPRLGQLASELQATNRQLSRILQQLDEAPQSVLSGAPERVPGPGEAGFVAPQPGGR